MKAEVIREIVHSTFEARNGVALKRYEHIADDEVRALTYNIRILERAGFIVLPKEELEAALKPFAEEADAWEEMGDTRPVIGDDSPVTVADRRGVAALLAAITQEKKS